MADESQLKSLHAAVNCYLSAVSAVADCLAISCPPVGGLYRHQLDRLRARLAFDSSPQALEESCAAMQEVLVEYSAKASEYIAGHRVQLNVAIAALEDIVWSLAERQEFYGGRLRQFAQQMETTPYPTDPEHLQEVVALQSAGLVSCVESMSRVTESLVSRMHQELAAADRRVKDSEIADPLTGVFNRREIDRQIEARKAAGESPILLHFLVAGSDGALTDQLLKQVADRLAGQFRHEDLIGRWTENEFMVLFDGPLEAAESRAEVIVPWVAGRYPLPSGDSVEVEIEVRLLASPPAGAPTPSELVESTA